MAITLRYFEAGVLTQEHIENASMVYALNLCEAMRHTAELAIRDKSGRTLANTYVEKTGAIQCPTCGRWQSGIAPRESMCDTCGFPYGAGSGGVRW